MLNVYTPSLPLAGDAGTPRVEPVTFWLLLEKNQSSGSKLTGVRTYWIPAARNKRGRGIGNLFSKLLIETTFDYVKELMFTKNPGPGRLGLVDFQNPIK
jgi:hypothetical protein